MGGNKGMRRLVSCVLGAGVVLLAGSANVALGETFHFNKNRPPKALSASACNPTYALPGVVFGWMGDLSNENGTEGAEIVCPVDLQMFTDAKSTEAPYAQGADYYYLPSYIAVYGSDPSSNRTCCSMVVHFLDTGVVTFGPSVCASSSSFSLKVRFPPIAHSPGGEQYPTQYYGTTTNNPAYTLRCTIPPKSPTASASRIFGYGR